MPKNKQTGFALVFVILSVSAWLLIGFGTWRVVASDRHSAMTKTSAAQSVRESTAKSNSSTAATTAAKTATTSPAATATTKTTSTKATTSASTSSGPSKTSGTNTVSQSTARTYVVTYLSSGFSPSTLTIKAGDTVTFKNSCSKDVWPASDPHPTHSDYPAFDPGKAIPPGGEWSFTFTKVGTWGYHNHLQPGQIGTIIVQ